MLQVKQFTFNAFAENTYIVYNEQQQCIIIDPGMYTPAEQDLFFGYIEQERLQPQMIVNTHCHLDHIFGVDACVAKYGIPFTFHKLEQPIYDWAPEAGARYGVAVYRETPPSFYLDENKKLMLGSDALEVRLAPGHSPGHVILYSKQDAFAVVADVIFDGSVGRTDLPGGDFDTLIQSIHREVFALPNETVLYCGHGGSTTVGNQKMNNPFVRSGA